MRKGGGHAKGAAFERRMCRALSLWISEGKAEDLFWRSAMSGGRATLMAKKGKKASAQAGDISAIHPKAHVLTSSFVVECKFYADLHLQYLLFGGKGGIIEFWTQVCRDAKRNDKHPMLIAKQNRYPEILCLGGWEQGGLEPYCLRINLKPKLICPQYGMYIYLLKDFLENTGIAN